MVRNPHRYLQQFKTRKFIENVSEISEENIRKDYLLESHMYPKGRDIDGKLIFYFKGILHIRGARNSDDVKRCFLYWLERILREAKQDQITLIFDLLNTGMKNVDLDLTNYQINTLKNYYPNATNWILIYEMPWIMNGL